MQWSFCFKDVSDGFEKIWTRFNISQSRKITGVFYTLAIFVKQKISTGEEVFCFGFQQSVVIAHDIVQAIWTERVMLQFQEVLSIYKRELWCELTIAILIWDNVDLCFGEKYTLRSSLEWEGGQNLDVGSMFSIWKEFSICEWPFNLIRRFILEIYVWKFIFIFQRLCKLFMTYYIMATSVNLFVFFYIWFILLN